jgi:hypothetical protein
MKEFWDDPRESQPEIPNTTPPRRQADGQTLPGAPVNVLKEPMPSGIVVHVKGNDGLGTGRDNPAPVTVAINPPAGTGSGQAGEVVEAN